MKKAVYYIIGIAAWMCSAASCNSNNYSNQLRAEQKQISNYISREGINVLTEMPADDYVWGEKDYYQVNGYDYLYFHLIQRGDSIRINGQDTVKIKPIRTNEKVILRYKRYTLTETPDTTSYWSTLDSAYPVTFGYMSNSTNACTGWQLAIQLMRYPNSECQVIVPSKLGFADDSQLVIPYGYRLKIKVDR